MNENEVNVGAVLLAVLRIALFAVALWILFTEVSPAAAAEEWSKAIFYLIIAIWLLWTPRD